MGRRKKEPEEFDAMRMPLPKNPTEDERRDTWAYVIDVMVGLQAYVQDPDSLVSHQDWRDQFEKIENLRKNHFKGSPEIKDAMRLCIQQGIDSFANRIQKITSEDLANATARFRDCDVEDLERKHIWKYWMENHDCILWLNEIQKAVFGGRVYKEFAPALVHSALENVVAPFWATTIQLKIGKGFAANSSELEHLYAGFASRIYPYDEEGYNHGLELLRNKVNELLAAEAAPKNGEVTTI